MTRIGPIAFVALATSLFMSASALADGQDVWLASRQAEFKVWQAAHPGRIAARRLWDAPEAPRMTSVPAGEFLMGSPEGEPDRQAQEGPQHRVVIAHPFAVSTYQVTRGEYAAFVAATKRGDPESCRVTSGAAQTGETKGINWHNPGFAQTERDPVVCVSWEDGRAYAAWLSQRTGKSGARKPSRSSA